MADILVQKDAATLIAKLGITADQRTAWALDYTIYDINADGTKGPAYGPTRTKTNRPGDIVVDAYGNPKISPTGDSAASLVSGAGTPYLGVVATRCYVPSANNGNVQAMARSQHIARDTLTAVKLLYANWIASGSSEAGNGGVSSFRAAIEYPAGVINGQALFGGAVTGTAASGSNVLSDFIQLATPIPPGAKFWVRTWCSSTVGSSFTTVIGSTGIDMITAGATVADNTMNPGSNPGAATTTILTPVAILAMTTKPSVLITGDSIAHGSNDSNGSTDPGDQGIFARSIGQFAGYIDSALPGESVASYLGANANRKLLKQYVSHVVTDYGTQDLGGGAATWLTNITAFAALFSDKTVYQSTIVPRTTSTDSFVTVANQTVTANEPQRLIMNGHIRNGNVPGIAGYFDTERALESSYQSGFWQVIPGSISPATPAMTADGTHPNRTGYLRIPAMNVIPSGAFTR